MSIQITDVLLRRLCQVNAFPVNESEMVFFGFRGCVPADPSDQSFSSSRAVNLTPLNFQNPRCVIGQWKPADKTLAVFPGSTVPTAKLIEVAVKNEGEGTNQLFTGRYQFEKGIHRAGAPTGHRAFRQVGMRVFLRTADDPIFELSDRLDSGNPCDNLHAAFGLGLSGSYSSAGCQVVVGTPKCERFSDQGPWVRFRDNGYEHQQDIFEYVLFDAAEADQLDDDISAPHPLLLRCGSHKSALPADGADVIDRVQDSLKKNGFYDGPIDGDFGAGSALAAIKFQRKAFGFSQADGIVGRTTAQALNITDWPTIT